MLVNKLISLEAMLQPTHLILTGVECAATSSKAKKEEGQLPGMSDWATEACVHCIGVDDVTDEDEDKEEDKEKDGDEDEGIRGQGQGEEQG